MRSVSLPKGCGLGYTYPNLVVEGQRLYLFLRGPCLQPIFTWTADGRNWARARTLMLGRPRPGGHERPYAKYAGGLLPTVDAGRTWAEWPVAQRPGADFRPVFARGEPAGEPPLLEWVAGDAPDFRRFHTRVVMSVAP